MGNYTTWNDKGIPVEQDRINIESAVAKALALKKPIRFWAAPNLPNAWYQMMRFKVDYINTDKIYEISSFLNKLLANSFQNTAKQPIYKPTYRYDKKDEEVKNVILLIGDEWDWRKYMPDIRQIMES